MRGMNVTKELSAHMKQTNNKHLNEGSKLHAESSHTEPLKRSEQTIEQLHLV